MKGEGLMKYYLAYGSNLSVRQMNMRCPDAKVVGLARVKDWKLTFKTYADIVPAKGRTVPVLVWEISEDDERSLDRYEGFPRSYIKKEFSVTMTDLLGRNPVDITGMAYIMTNRRTENEPPDYYYQILEQGYRWFGFDERILRRALYEVIA